MTLTEKEYRVLEAVRADRFASNEDIRKAAKLGKIGKQAVNGYLKRLERKGYIKVMNAPRELLDTSSAQ